MSNLRQVGLIAVCDDPQLFDFELWPRQRELLEAIEGGLRLHIWALGRRSGKTTLAALARPSDRGSQQSLSVPPA